MSANIRSTNSVKRELKALRPKEKRLLASNESNISHVTKTSNVLEEGKVQILKPLAWKKKKVHEEFLVKLFQKYYILTKLKSNEINAKMCHHFDPL